MAKTIFALQDSASLASSSAFLLLLNQSSLVIKTLLCFISNLISQCCCDYSLRKVLYRYNLLKTCDHSTFSENYVVVFSSTQGSQQYVLHPSLKPLCPPPNLSSVPSKPAYTLLLHKPYIYPWPSSFSSPFSLP